MIGLGIFFMGLAIKAGIDNVAYRDRNVTVRGLSEREVKADRVCWPMEYSVAGDNLPDIYGRIQANNKAIEEFLTGNGIARGDISIAPPETYNASTNQWASTAVSFKYSLTTVVTVSTGKVEKVRELLQRQGELLAKGIPVNNRYINYEFTGLNDIKPEMIAQATKNAREAAGQFAKDSGSRLGKMKTATQGQFTIENAAESTPWEKRVRVVTTIVYYLED